MVYHESCVLIGYATKGLFGDRPCLERKTKRCRADFRKINKIKEKKAAFIVTLKWLFSIFTDKLVETGFDEILPVFSAKFAPDRTATQPIKKLTVKITPQL